METSISDFFISHRGRDCFYVKEKYGASFTVEASFIMVVVLLSLLSLLKWSFFLHDMTVASAHLHLQIERERLLEEEKPREWHSTVKLLFYDNDGMDIKIKEDSVNGVWKAGNIKKQITSSKYHPEDFIRAVDAFFKQTGGNKDGSILPERDSAQLFDH